MWPHALLSDAPRPFAARRLDSWHIEKGITLVTVRVTILAKCHTQSGPKDGLEGHERRQLREFCLCCSHGVQDGPPCTWVCFTEPHMKAWPHFAVRSMCTSDVHEL